MTRTKEFFIDQTEVTKLKLLFFNNYIELYLYKILNSFGSCRIFDPFCGPGKAGVNLGSPLVLLSKIKKVISTPITNARIKFDVKIFFSDSDANNIKSLKSELEKWQIEKTNIYCEQSNFEDTFDFLVNSKMANSRIPKFIFLDPFGYSRIPIEKIKSLSSITLCEILLFIPLMDIYRFSNLDPEKMETGTKIFLETYTDRPLNGKNTFTSPKDLMLSINKKLQNELSKYVRPMLFNAGSRKNCLFLITGNIKGLILANELFCKNSQSRLSVNTSDDLVKNQTVLDIEVENIDTTECEKLILDSINESTILTNNDIIKLAAVNYFCISHIEEVLSKLCKKGTIELKRIKKSTRYCIGSTNLDEKPKIEFRLKDK